MENKFTDNEIINCLNDTEGKEDIGIYCTDKNGNFKTVIKLTDLIDLLNCQKAEIERLNVELVGMRGACESYKIHYDNAKAEIERLQKANDSLGEAGGKLVVAYKKAKSEARKEFAELIKQRTTDRSIDELLEEVEEESDKL